MKLISLSLTTSNIYYKFNLLLNDKCTAETSLTEIQDDHESARLHQSHKFDINTRIQILISSFMYKLSADEIRYQVLHIVVSCDASPSGKFRQPPIMLMPSRFSMFGHMNTESASSLLPSSAAACSKSAMPVK